MPPSWSHVIDNMFTTTWSYRKGPAIEQAFLNNPFFFWLKDKGKTIPLQGYTRIEIPLDYANNETVRWIGKGDVVPMSETEFLTMAYEEWRYVAVNILRYGVEDQKNKSKAQLINYVDSKIKAAERSLNESFELALCADGSGSKEPNGLQNLFENTAEASQTSTIHGLSRSTYAWWRNQRKAATGSYSVYLLSDMKTALNNVTKYSQTSINDIVILCDQTSYEYYEEEVMEQKVIMNQKLGDAGFDSVQYKGRPLIWSPSAPSLQMRFINTNYLSFMYDPDYYMEMTEWKPIPDQVNDKVAQIVSACNFVTSRPIANLVLTLSA